MFAMRTSNPKEDLENVMKFFGLAVDDPLLLSITRLDASAAARIAAGNDTRPRTHLALLADFVLEARTYLFKVRDWASWTSQDALVMHKWLTDDTIILKGEKYPCTSGSCGKAPSMRSPLEILSNTRLLRMAFSDLYRVTE